MALGLLLLVSVGKENIYLSSDPEITFFKIEHTSHIANHGFCRHGTEGGNLRHGIYAVLLLNIS